jgi:polyhydroxyalkanoate synthesis regulator phasin
MTDEELKKLFETSEANTRRHFDVVGERLDKRIDTLAETVALLDEKVTREIASVRDEMRHGFIETQAMIKFSYSELDRRLTSLESRVDKLEAKR